MRIRCVTLNLLGLAEGWFEQREVATKNGLKPLGPDILCLQETTVCGGPGYYNQARALGEELGLKSLAFAPYGNEAESTSLEIGGVAVLSRWPLLRVHSRRLPAPTDARVALFVVLATPSGELEVITTHLSWRPNEAVNREVQMRLIVDSHKPEKWADQNYPRLLMGDLNAVSEEPGIQLIKPYFRDAYKSLHPELSGHTWIEKNPLTRKWSLPDRRIDYIFCSKWLKINRADVVLNRPSPDYASDHFGVLADIDWKNA